MTITPIDPPGPVGEAGARLRALAQKWRSKGLDLCPPGQVPHDGWTALQSHERTLGAVIWQCADELDLELDALLSAPVVSGWQPIAAKLVEQWGEGYLRYPGDELPDDWFQRMLALLREIAGAPVVSPPQEERCQSCGRELSLICFPCAENGPPRKDAAAPGRNPRSWTITESTPVVTQEGE